MAICITSACKRKNECDKKAQAAAALASSQGQIAMAAAYSKTYDDCIKSSNMTPNTNGWDFLNNVFNFYKDVKSSGSGSDSDNNTPVPDNKKTVLGLPPAAGYTALAVGGGLIIYAIYHIATVNK